MLAMEEVAALDFPSNDEPYSLAVCANCGTESAGKFCSQCGQKHRTPHDLKVSSFLRHVVEEFTSLDSKIFLSLRSLLFHPGKLTAEWMAGRERSYVKPIQLFLVVNLAYWVLLHFSHVTTFTTPLRVQYAQEGYSALVRPIVDDQVRTSGLTFEQFENSYNESSASQARSLVILMVPMFAGVLSLLYLFRKRYVVEHLIFSLHFYAFFLILVSVGVLLIALVVELLAAKFHWSLKGMDWEALFTYIPGLISMAYLLFALRRVYHDSWLSASIRAFVLTYCILVVLTAYRFLLFFSTIYTMHAKV